MRYFHIMFFLLLLNSCGYPDIDTVPDFKNAVLTEEEINDFCSNISDNIKDIDKCVNDYKSKN